MIKLYLQKLFVNEIGFMNQQMAVVALFDIWTTFVKMLNLIQTLAVKRGIVIVEMTNKCLFRVLTVFWTRLGNVGPILRNRETDTGLF